MAWLSTGVAWAADSGRPEVVLRAADAALARRIRAEAAQVGLDVVRERASERSVSEAELMDAHGAVAVIDVSDPAHPVIWFRAKGGELGQRILPAAPSEDGMAVVAVEGVRATLLELDLLEEAFDASGSSLRRTDAPTGSRTGDPRPVTNGASAAEQDAPRPEAASATVSTAGAPSTQGDVPGDDAGSTGGNGGAHLWLYVGPAGTFPAGGMGPAAHGAVGLAVEPSSRWRLGGAVWLPITEGEWSRGGVEAESRSTLFLSHVGYVPLRGPAGSLEGGLGVGLLSLSVGGETTGPERIRSDRLFAGAAYAHAGGAWNVAPWFRLRVTALGGTSAPRPVVEIAGERTATWGRLFGAVMLGAELGVALSTGEASP